MTTAATLPTVEHVSDWRREDNSEWLWRISPRDDLLVQKLSPATTISDFANTESQRDWWLKQYEGYGAEPGDYAAERVPGPLARAIADDKARRRALVDAAHEKRKAEREAQLAAERGAQ